MSTRISQKYIKIGDVLFNSFGSSSSTWASNSKSAVVVRIINTKDKSYVFSNQPIFKKISQAVDLSSKQIDPKKKTT